MRIRSCLFSAVLVAALASAARADVSLDADQRKRAVEALARALRSQHASPAEAERAARELLRTLAAGGYDQDGATAFAQALTRDLQTLTGDRHAGVRFDPDSRMSVDPEAELAPKEKANLQRLLGRQNFGVSEVRLLPGNVGLLELRYFAPADFATPTLAAAMRLVANTDALIIDLRHNDGGDARTVAFLCTYFFPEGSRVHLDDVFYRGKNETRAGWTRTSVPGPRYLGKPIYMLVGPGTFSGGEELVYVLQAARRATVLGETTAGVANTGQAIPLGAGLVALIPTGRTINAVTGSSWEGVGVRPDVPVPVAQGLDVAHASALRAVLARETDGEYRRMLERLLAMLEKGERQ